MTSCSKGSLNLFLKFIWFVFVTLATLGAKHTHCTTGGEGWEGRSVNNWKTHSMFLFQLQEGCTTGCLTEISVLRHYVSLRWFKQNKSSHGIPRTELTASPHCCSLESPYSEINISHRTFWKGIYQTRPIPRTTNMKLPSTSLRLKLVKAL